MKIRPRGSTKGMFLYRCLRLTSLSFPKRTRCNSDEIPCPLSHFFTRFLLSMLDYCINCSSRVDTEIYSGPNVKKIQLINKCHEICLMSTCVQTKV